MSLEPKFLSGVGGLVPEERRRFRLLEESARVLRWHTECVARQQTVGEHTYGVVNLVLELTGDEASKALIIAALRHDTAERKFGDVPGPTKRLMNVKESFDKLEEDHMASVGLYMPSLTDEDQRILKLADNLEGAMYCAFEARRGNRDIQGAFRNYLNYIHEMKPTHLAARLYMDLFAEYQHVFG
jgi:5'-deoxynucleotidase YfbR-like HD superfamily hydrolase